MDIVRARWSSSSFLLYAGAFVVLVAAAVLLSWLQGDYSDGAFVGWSLLIFAAFAAATVVFERAGLHVLAGLFAFISLMTFSVFVSSIEDLIGLLDADLGPFDVGQLLLELITIVAALVLLARFHFPLLALVATAVSWVFVADLISNGGDWSAVVSILVGLIFLLIGAGVDSTYGFWVQVVAGLAIGGGFLFLWHSADWEWVLIAIVALFFFLFAAGLDRSSYAVFGAIGLFLAWSHFVEDWLDSSSGITADPSDPLSSVYSVASSTWSHALLYGLYGLVLIAIGLWLERRRSPADVSLASA